MEIMDWVLKKDVFSGKAADRLLQVSTMARSEN
jgi:hypothetical protein